jgi:outer membrane immunogenic protein
MNLSTSRISGLSRLAFAATLAVTSVTFAPAAHAGPPPVPVPAFSWTGFYVGLHGGWGWANTEVQDPVIFSPIFNPTEYKYNGPLVGAQIGGNYQIGNFVLGAEIDGSWSFVRGVPSTIDNGVIAATQKNLLSYRSFATATGRVGYTMGQWLAYVKGGAAAANMEVVSTYTADGPTTVERSLVGWTAGAGLEVAFLRNVSAKAEYNFIRLPEDHFTYVYFNSVSGLEHFVHVVKVGINVRFGGDAGFPR